MNKEQIIKIIIEDLQNNGLISRELQRLSMTPMTDEQIEERIVQELQIRRQFKADGRSF